MCYYNYFYEQNLQIEWKLIPCQLVLPEIEILGCPENQVQYNDKHTYITIVNHKKNNYLSDAPPSESETVELLPRQLLETVRCTGRVPPPQISCDGCDCPPPHGTIPPPEIISGK